MNVSYARIYVRQTIEYVKQLKQELKKGLATLFGLVFLVALLAGFTWIVIVLAGIITPNHEPTTEEKLEREIRELRQELERVKVLAINKQRIVIEDSVKAVEYKPAGKAPMPVYDVSAIKILVINTANKYGVSSERLLRIADCESGFNPYAVNYNYFAGGGHPTGLFQYLPETWTRYQRKLGVSGWNIFNPAQQAELTAFAFSIGGSGEWECK